MLLSSMIPPPATVEAPPPVAPPPEAQPQRPLTPVPSDATTKFMLAAGVAYVAVHSGFGSEPPAGELAATFDAGLRSDYVYFGLYASYGANTAALPSCPTYGCKDSPYQIASTTRGGISIRYLAPTLAERFAPWAGGGVGFDRTSLRQGEGDAQHPADYALELNLQGGLDIKPAPLVGIGPFVTLSGLRGIGPRAAGGAVMLGLRIALYL